MFFYFFIRFIFHRLNKPYKEEVSKSFSIIIPVFNEKPDIFRRCIESCAMQLTEDSEIIVVADADKSCYNIACEYANKNPKIKVIYHEERKGKRVAHATALKYAKGEIIVTVDSDTILYADAIKELLKPFADPTIGAVTGLVKVYNRDENILTRLLNIRYIMAGIFDRGSYSYFKVVNCTSGPFSAYRRSIFLKVLHEYVHQTHRNRICTFGDERCLTNLILKSGYNVFYQKTAVCETLIPSDFKTWLKQQLRWCRSFWRESWITLHYCWRRSKYLTFGTIMDCALPFLCISSLVFAIFNGIVSASTFVLFPYMLSTIGMAFLRNFRYFEITKKVDYFIIPLYAILYIFVLLPLSLYALFTTNSVSWMTR
jgi:hyaluronan synthase/N-acetylglucosaminyltransferase